MNLSISSVIVIFAFCIACPTGLLAQGKSAKQDTNGIVVVQDKRIPKLVDTYVKTQPSGVPGYRVQVFFTAKKAIALEKKTTFTEKFPDYVAEVDYDNPHFKVLAGAFRTKLQAEKLLRLVREEFPGSFIVKGNIPLEQLN
ncbi:SPOR domain-containing protein [Flavobacteriales bacterium AH-315-E23]|nr:SPOR domain-containing protein [Flavobacteriales bacterium AH-315-E23]